MDIIKINPNKFDFKVIKRVVKIIKNGEVVVYPTDTCYGIGASAFNEKAIIKVYKIKDRDFSKPLSVIVKNLKVAKTIAYISKRQEQYFQKKLPGPYTLVFKKKRILPNVLTAGKDTIGIRVPDYLITQLISEELLIPYTTTSANISGSLPCYSIPEFLKQIKNNKFLPDLILDAGKLPKMKLSKIIDLTGQKYKILRE